MKDNTDPWKIIKRWLALVICAGYIGYAIPRNLVAERQGVRIDGIVVGYQVSSIGWYYYPIVRITSQGGQFDLKSTESWRWKWYDIGARVPVLNLPGRACLVGSLLLRWSRVLLATGALAAASLWAFWQPSKKMKTEPNQTPTSTAVTPPADAGDRASALVAHLDR